MKRLTIRAIGSKHPLYKIQLRPGTRVNDVLSHFKLSGYVLVPAAPSVDDLPKEIFDRSAGDDLYERVEDGSKLIAIPAFEAARIGFEIMMRKHSPKETIR